MSRNHSILQVLVQLTWDFCVILWHSKLQIMCIPLGNARNVFNNIIWTIIISEWVILLVTEGQKTHYCSIKEPEVACVKKSIWSILMYYSLHTSHCILFERSLCFICGTCFSSACNPSQGCLYCPCVANVCLHVCVCVFSTPLNYPVSQEQHLQWRTLQC